MSSATPSRAVHIGSLLRPKALFEKRLQLESKQCTPSELKSVEDAAIKHVLDLQRNVGLKIFSDGELRRFLWISTVMPWYFWPTYSIIDIFFMKECLTNSKGWYICPTVCFIQVHLFSVAYICWRAYQRIQNGRATWRFSFKVPPLIVIYLI